MRISKDENVIFWVQFTDPEGQAPAISGVPNITVRHYDSGIIDDVVGDDLTEIGNGLYYYSFQTSVDGFYCATIEAEYDTGEIVTGSQTVISGDPVKLVAFAHFTNQTGEEIQVTEAKGRIIKETEGGIAYSDLVNINGSLWYLVRNLVLGSDQYCADFNALYDGLTLRGGYTFGGSNVSNAVIGGLARVTNKQLPIAIHTSKSGLRIKDIDSTISIHTAQNKAQIKVTKSYEHIRNN